MQSLVIVLAQFGRLIFETRDKSSNGTFRGQNKKIIENVLLEFCDSK